MVAAWLASSPLCGPSHMDRTLFSVGLVRAAEFDILVGRDGMAVGIVFVALVGSFSQCVLLFRGAAVATVHIDLGTNCSFPSRVTVRAFVSLTWFGSSMARTSSTSGFPAVCCGSFVLASFCAI